jgi:hypothetical protein
MGWTSMDEAVYVTPQKKLGDALEIVEENLSQP